MTDDKVEQASKSYSIQSEQGTNPRTMKVPIAKVFTKNGENDVTRTTLDSFQVLGNIYWVSIIKTGEINPS